jgi:hypothetical protein
MGELVNCLGCGRDTRRKDGYCSGCLPYRYPNRPGLRENDDFPEIVTAIEDIHERDDIPLEDDYSEDSCVPVSAIRREVAATDN